MAGTGCGISFLSPQCPGQYLEIVEGPPARVVAAGPPGGSVRYGHCDLESNEWVSCRISSLSPQYPAQCSEIVAGPPARVVAAGPPAVLCVTAIAICKAMAGIGCGISASSLFLSVVRGRRWAPGGSGRYGHCALQSNNGWDRLRDLLSFPLSRRSVRRSVQRLQKGLRRAWSPLGPQRFCALLPL